VRRGIAALVWFFELPKGAGSSLLSLPVEKKESGDAWPLSEKWQPRALITFSSAFHPGIQFFSGVPWPF
jgi:hypothetical protein